MKIRSTAKKFTSLYFRHCTTPKSSFGGAPIIVHNTPTSHRLNPKPSNSLGPTASAQEQQIQSRDCFSGGPSQSCRVLVPLVALRFSSSAGDAIFQDILHSKDNEKVIDNSNQSELLLGSPVTEAAMLALKDYLVEVNGTSPKDAEFISKNCSTFLAALTASVAHLVQLGKGEEEESGSLQARIRKFIEKGDEDGVLGSPTHLLPIVEEVCSGRLLLGDMVLLQNFAPAASGHDGFMESMAILDSLGCSSHKLRGTLQRNPKLVTWTAEELQSKIRLLEKVGVKRKDMQCIMEDSKVFTLELEEKLKPLLSYLDEIGIQRDVLGDLVKFNRRGALSMPLAQFKERVDFLFDLGLSSPEVEGIMRSFPSLVHYRLACLTQKMKYFESIGVDRDTLVKIMPKQPYIFRPSIEKNLEPKVRMLENLGVGRSTFGKVLVRNPQFFRSSIEKLTEKLAFFEANGVTGARLSKMITQFPSCLGRSMDANSKKLEFLVSKGFLPGSTSMVRALASSIRLRSLSTRFQHLQSLGFTAEEVSELMKNQPSICNQSEESIRSKVDYLVNSMNRPRSEILKAPVFLLYSLEMRIKPRHRVVELLTSKGLLKKAVYSLNTILPPSEAMFMKRFVNLDQECIDIYWDMTRRGKSHLNTDISNSSAS